MGRIQSWASGTWVLVLPCHKISEPITPYLCLSASPSVWHAKIPSGTKDLFCVCCLQVKFWKPCLFEVETVTIPVTARFALLEGIWKDCMYPRQRPRQPTSEALPILFLCMVSSHTVSFHGVLGTRGPEASSATGAVGLSGDVRSRTDVNQGALRPKVSSWEQLPVVYQWSRFEALLLFNKKLSFYCFENVRGSLKPVWRMRENYKSSVMTLKTEIFWIGPLIYSVSLDGSLFYPGCITLMS